MDPEDRSPTVPSIGSSALPDGAELIDEIVLREDVIGADGDVIGEHIEVIDLVEVDGEGIVVIDDVTIVTDDEGDVMIEETIATFDEAGDAIVDSTRVIIDAEGDVLIEERISGIDSTGEMATTESITVLDAAELDERAMAQQLRAELDDVAHALDRLDAGTYATCESCGDEIDDEVLAVRPQARACAAHLLT